MKNIVSKLIEKLPVVIARCSSTVCIRSFQEKSILIECLNVSESVLVVVLELTKVFGDRWLPKVHHSWRVLDIRPAEPSVRSIRNVDRIFDNFGCLVDPAWSAFVNGRSSLELFFLKFHYFFRDLRRAWRKAKKASLFKIKVSTFFISKLSLDILLKIEKKSSLL